MKFLTPSLSLRLMRRILALLAAAAALVPTHPVQAQQGSLQSLADREIVRRQEDLLVAKQLVRKADDAAGAKDFESAYVLYLDALEKIPNGGASNDQREDVVEEFGNVAVAYAQELIANGRYGEAERVAKTILLPQFDPKNTTAVQLLSNLEQSDYYNKTTTPGFAADRSEVVKLLHEAEGFEQSGRYDLSLKRYEQVLNIDRYNTAARRGMEDVTNRKSKYYGNAYNETRSRMLWLVEETWERPVRNFKGNLSTGADIKSSNDPRSTEVITAKLNRIIIPKINLQDVTVREAVEFLKQRSRELDNTVTDPDEKRGVNLVLKLPNAPAASTAVELAESTPGAEDSTLSDQPQGGNADTKITLTLTNVPMIEALRYLTELAGLKYKIEPYAVSIVPITENTSELLTKQYRVPPGFIPNTAAPDDTGSTPGGTGSAALAGKQSAQQYLESLGVPMPTGSFAQYVAAGSKLIVRNTADSIDIIDSLVDAVTGVQPTQVEIESKFLEISQNNLKELGFDWLLGPLSIGGGVYGAGGTQGYGDEINPTAPAAADYPFLAGGQPVGQNPVTAGLRSGAGIGPNAAVTANSINALLESIPTGVAPGIFGLSGIFTNPQFQVVIRALNQKKGVDLMSAPKVTTKSGRKAIVKVVRSFPYPTEFNPPEPPPTATGQGQQTTNPIGALISGGVVTPSTPTTFETRDIGVTMEVEPIIGPDGYTIDLNLSPEVVEFDGFINYGSPILGAIFNFTTLSIGQTVLTPNVINQPIFSTRKVTTSVSIWDGQTVALGGLIREDVQKVQDKVPLLGDIPIMGRLFRSNVDQKIKSNLIIFVTARLIDAEGRPVRQDDELDESVDALGLPKDLARPTFETARGPGK